MRIWKDITGFEGRYQVSNDGYVRSLPDIDERGRFMTGRILSPSVDIKRRQHVILGDATYRIHRLVSFAFLPLIEGKEQINHKDGNPSNNNVDNLEWCDGSENIKHSYDVLRRVRPLLGKTGALCANSKPVRGIRVSDGTVCEYAAASEAARELNIDASGISMCARGKLRTYKGWIWAYV